MNNETILKITHLEGYAGLRLKDNSELEKNHYTFCSDEINFEKLKITKKIREIIH
jgi:hypothetical protein